MPNGKPGDHPLTDILVHGMEVFGPYADALIKEIIELGGQDDLEQRFDLLLLDPRFAGPRPLSTHVNLQELEVHLTNLRDALRRDRLARGWDADHR